jgi:capsular polysaccharide biosynthesis protein
MKSHHFHAFGRFWWLLAIGAGVALIVAVATVASISTGVPPKVTYRSHPTFSATQQELVTSQNNPFLRTQQRTVVTNPARRATGGANNRSTTTPQPTVQVQPPNVDVLVRAANYYPYLIQSDQVLAIRDRRFGQLTGEVTAQALNSFQTANRFRESTFPIIEIVGNAPTADEAKKVTQATVVAFREWLTKSQNAAHVPDNERVLIQDLQRSGEAVAIGGPKHGLDIIVGIVVFALFAAAALVLDRLFPRARPGNAAHSADGLRVSQLELDLQPAVATEEPTELSATRWAAEGRGV